MEFPKISVLMSAYNEPINYVKEAVDSILNQTYRNIEFIIVVDNPRDNELIEYFRNVEKQDNRVILLVNEQNIGLAMSLNRALSESNGTIVARMDADDISKPDRLEKEYSYLSEHKLDVIGCAVDKIDENGIAWGTIESYSNNYKDYAKLLPIQNVIVHPSTMMIASAVKKVDGYRNFSSCQDYDLWLRLLSEGYKFGVCPENLFQFRRHKSSVTATKRYGQYLNESYIRRLYAERNTNKGHDSFSEERLKAYLTSKGFYNKEKSEKQNQLLILYSHGIKEIKNHHYINGLLEVARSLTSSAVRDNIRISIMSKRMRKKVRWKVSLQDGSQGNN